MKPAAIHYGFGLALILGCISAFGQVPEVPADTALKEILNPAAADQQQGPPKDTSYWKGSFKGGANLTQASFSDNWKAGGVNSIAYNLLLQSKADYVRARTTFHFEADLQFGSVKNQDVEWRKTVDRIFLDAKYGYAFAPAWSFFGSLNLLSQFAPGYKYAFKDAQGNEFQYRLRISGGFSPTYFTQSVGVEYKPVDYFFVRFGTGTLRQTFVKRKTVPPPVERRFEDSLYLVETKNYGVPLGEHVRYEFAVQLLASFDRDIATNLNLKARYIAFLNYGFITVPRQWDHRLETTLMAKINRYVNTTLTGILVYDHDTDNRIQYSQALTLGLLITLGDTK